MILGFAGPAVVVAADAARVHGDHRLAEILLGAVEVAGVPLQFGKTRLYEAINSGALKAHKQGAHTIIMHDDLEAWLRSLPEYEPAPKAA